MSRLICINEIRQEGPRDLGGSPPELRSGERLSSPTSSNELLMDQPFQEDFMCKRNGQETLR